MLAVMEHALILAFLVSSYFSPHSYSSCSLWQCPIVFGGPLGELTSALQSLGVVPWLNSLRSTISKGSPTLTVLFSLCTTSLQGACSPAKHKTSKQSLFSMHYAECIKPSYSSCPHTLGYPTARLKCHAWLFHGMRYATVTQAMGTGASVWRS